MNGGPVSIPTVQLAFTDWITLVFDHRVTQHEWYFSTDTDWEEGDPRVTVQHLTRLFEEPAVILDRHSPEQINQGLWFLVSSSCSNDMVALLDDSVPREDRKRCIVSIGSLFKKLFSVVCTDHLSHLDRGATAPTSVNPINLVCFMWWDLFPRLDEPDDPSWWEMDATILEVLRGILSLSSVACRESALHGLGHWHLYHPDRVEEIIDEFLTSVTLIDAELRKYAKAARMGGVL